MGIDQNEARQQRAADKPKLSGKHPIAAIEKRVIDSESFAHLPASAVVVLLLMARNLEKDRNGHVFLAASDAARHGINERTLYRQLKLLVAHGFLCQTKRGGNGVCAKYALAWLPLTKDTAGIHVDHFRGAASWRDWKPATQKKATVKMSGATRQKYRFAPDLADKNAARVPDIFTDIECNTNTDCSSVPQVEWLEPGSVHKRGRSKAWIPDYLTRLEAKGQSGRQCFQTPQGRTLQ